MASGGLRQCVQDTTYVLSLAIFVSTLAVLQFGFHLSELNAPQDVITCHKKSITSSTASPTLPQCLPMTNEQFAIVTSIYTLGGFIGAISGGPISSSYGRLIAMGCTSFFFIVGSVLETVASNIATISVGRLLSGLGAGASTVIVPLYISEIAPPRERGLFGAMTQISINVGILIAQTLGYFLSRGSLWRIVLAVGAALGVLQSLGLLAIPESPAWLAAHGKGKQAVDTLQRIRGKDIDIEEEIETWDVKITGIAEEERLLSGSENLSSSQTLSPRPPNKKEHQVGFLEAFRDPLYRPAIIAVIGVMCAQQFTGINSIIMYSVSLLSDLLPTTSALLSIVISVLNLVVTISCAPLSDKFGRKRCLLISIAGMGTSSLALAFSILFRVKVLSALSVLAFVGAFGVGLGPVPFILASELVGQEAVGVTQSWALCSNWVSTFIVAQFFPIINARLGGNGYVYFIFAALALLFCLFVARFVPETKGKKDADEVWGRTRRVD